MVNGPLHVIVAGVVCFVCIAIRTGYRIAFQCRIHSACHRQYHVDDVWMALSFFPLLGRVLCITWSEVLLAHPGISDGETWTSRAMTGKMLLIPGRIFYALFLWLEKLCLLELYLRICDALPAYQQTGIAIRYALYLTFIGIMLATLLECHPLKLNWNGDPAGALCRKARANLIVLAACNIATDLALIIFPISFLRTAGLGLSKSIRLGVLFALGSLIIITTIIRLPLILRDDAQKVRSLWASIEIACACVVANAPFFHAVLVDMQPGGVHATPSTITQCSMDNKSGTSRPGSDGGISFIHMEQRPTQLDEEGKSSPTGRHFDSYMPVEQPGVTWNPLNDEITSSLRDDTLGNKKLAD